jgi:NADH:ubiquinone oxidoreductase subunit F (NADH-binding)
MAALRPQHLLPDAPFATYAEYLAATGENAVRKARAMGPDAVLAELQRSKLRGRGGAGFPAGVKWSSIRAHPCPTRDVVCNAAEGEPGTFKDRFLLRRNPYAPLEGMIVAADVIGARGLYVVVKASFERELERLRAAAEEIGRHGLLGAREIVFVEGPEEYLLGEEKALLEVVEGNDPLPREAHYPPYERGLFATPTSPNPALVNNVQTYAHVPGIVRLGAASFAALGTEDTTGTILFTVSGDVRRPGVYELPAGITLRRLFTEVAGGPRAGRRLKAAIGGVSSAVIDESRFDVPADFGSLEVVGASLGSAGFVVLDDSRSMPRVAQAVARFLYVESCNQCSACKHGLRTASHALDRMLDPARATPDDLESVLYGARSAPQGNRCYLPVQGSIVVPALLAKYRAEFEALRADPGASLPPFLIPKMVDFDERTRAFRYDPAQPRKRPDWTYAEPGPSPRAPRAKVPSPGARAPGPLSVQLAPDVRERLSALAAERGADAERLANEALRRWLDAEP